MCKDPVSKKGHICGYQGLGVDITFGGDSSTHYSFYVISEALQK